MTGRPLAPGSPVTSSRMTSRHSISIIKYGVENQYLSMASRNNQIQNLKKRNDLKNYYVSLVDEVSHSSLQMSAWSPPSLLLLPFLPLLPPFLGTCSNCQASLNPDSSRVPPVIHLTTGRAKKGTRETRMGHNISIHLPIQTLMKSRSPTRF